MKKFAALFCCALITFFAAGCSVTPQQSSSSENPEFSLSSEASGSSQPSGSSQNDPSSQSSAPPQQEQRFNYSPYLVSDVCKEVLGADFPIYCKLVDAYISHADSVSGFENEEQFFKLWSIFFREFYPSQKIAATYLTHDEPYSFADGTAVLHYQASKEECDRLLAEYEDKINGILAQIDQNDSEIEIIQKMYRYVSDNVTYSFGMDSMYDVIMQNKGVCGGYAEYLILLLRHAGIESMLCNSLDNTQSGMDHAWVIAKLGGEYFHFDPTWQADAVGGWYWFAMSDDMRLRSLSPDWTAALMMGDNPYFSDSIPIPDVDFIGKTHPIENKKLELPKCSSTYYDERRFGNEAPPCEW